MSLWSHYPKNFADTLILLLFYFWFVLIFSLQNCFGLIWKCWPIFKLIGLFCSIGWLVIPAFDFSVWYGSYDLILVSILAFAALRRGQHIFNFSRFVTFLTFYSLFVFIFVFKRSSHKLLYMMESQKWFHWTSSGFLA